MAFWAALVKAWRQLSFKNCAVASSGQPTSRRPWANRTTTSSSNHLRALAGSRILTESSISENICAVSGIVFEFFPLYFHQCGKFAGVTLQTTIPPSYCPTGNSLPTLQAALHSRATIWNLTGEAMFVKGKMFGNTKKYEEFG